MAAVGAEGLGEPAAAGRRHTSGGDTQLHHRSPHNHVIELEDMAGMSQQPPFATSFSDLGYSIKTPQEAAFLRPAVPQPTGFLRGRGTLYGELLESHLLTTMKSSNLV